MLQFMPLIIWLVILLVKYYNAQDTNIKIFNKIHTHTNGQLKLTRLYDEGYKPQSMF